MESMISLIAFQVGLFAWMALTEFVLFRGESIGPDAGLTPTAQPTSPVAPATDSAFARSKSFESTFR